jgi:peptidoglycan/LPS O-acetylase OafA/YrhL
MGTIRFLLALSVAMFHLTGRVPTIGLFAVFGFYVISGFLMALVVNERYASRFGAFVANQALRLYPSYLAIAAATVAAFLLLPGYQGFHAAWAPAPDVKSILGNLLLFPWAVLADPVAPVTPWPQADTLLRLQPATWSVAIEMGCYLLAFAIGARSLVGAAVLTAVGIAWHVGVAITGGPATLRYAPIPAAALGFGFGCLVYFASSRWSQRLAALPLSATIAVGAVLFIANTVSTFSADPASQHAAVLREHRPDGAARSRCKSPPILWPSRSWRIRSS